MKVYFKNLDGIRFIAALMVILEHTSDYVASESTGYPNIFRKQFEDLGSYGVTLFFVLSGYLIFYLLFSEQKYKQTVSIKNFYIRRILRIWPLYLGFGLVLIFGIDFVMGKLGTPVHTPALNNLFYLLTFSINLQMLFAIPNRGIIELYWSVCIEEQFYLMAPWLVKKGHKKMLAVIIALIAVGLGSKFVLHYLEVQKLIHFNHESPLLYFFTLCRFDNFGFGALAAYIYFTKPLYQKIESIVKNKLFQLLVITLTILYIFHILPESEFSKTYLFSTIPSILFSFIIMAASTGDFLINLETPLLKLLGKYSYGIYVFHAVVSELLLVWFLKYLPAKSILTYNFLYPLASIIITATIAALSYEIYEKRFLQLKQRFAIVKSHDV